jgi:glycosyltransferase involved in cell wall biosynthesis
VKVALVHDWLTGMRGGERVLERLCAMFPGAPITTLVWKRGSVSPAIEAHSIRSSFLQYLPEATARYRWFLPLFPAAIESFRFEGFDAVVSTSHAVARAVITPPGTFHLSYIHTPMRYIWELEDQYFPPGRFPVPLAWAVHATCARLRKWDVATSGRPAALIANSAHVAARIQRHYGRAAEVIHPPVALDRFRAAQGPREYYLLAGAMAPYKRGELAIEACARLKRRLVVAGTGQQQADLARIAGPDVEFIGGWISDERMAQLYAGARALLFPGEEDFGIMPVEAMASGCPVIAFGAGGALETVGRDAGPGALAALARGESARVPGGVLFARQTVESMADAMRHFEREPFDPAALAACAAPFSVAEFDRGFRAAFDRDFAAWRAARGNSGPAPGARLDSAAH